MPLPYIAIRIVADNIAKYSPVVQSSEWIYMHPIAIVVADGACNPIAMSYRLSSYCVCTKLSNT